MKHAYRDSIKPFLHKEITNTAKELHLTQDQTAERLGIEPRSYAYFDAGKTMCSATTLLMYLANMCPNLPGFVAELKEVIEDAEQNQF